MEPERRDIERVLRRLSAPLRPRRTYPAGVGHLMANGSEKGVRVVYCLRCSTLDYDSSILLACSEMKR